MCVWWPFLYRSTISELHLLLREVLSKYVSGAEICRKHVQYALLEVYVPVYGAYCIGFVSYGFVLVRAPINGAYVDREPVFSTVVYILVRTYVARNALLDAASISQYMTPIQPNLLWTIFL